MSDTYGFPFGYFYSNDPVTKAPISWAQMEQRRKIAAALASRARPYPKTIGEGLTYAGETIGAALRERQLERDEAAASAYEDSIRRGAPGALTGARAEVGEASPAVDAVAALGSAVRSGTGAVGAPTLPGTEPSPVAQRVQPPPVQPQQPQQPTMRPSAARLPIPQAPPAVAEGMNRAFDERGIPPEQRPYYNTLAYNESKFDPNAVSPTGARGPFQFTRGTARQYGLNNPADPYASTLSAIDLTGDNRRALARRLGRDPTDAELALAHNQGATGASNLLSGRPAPARNLAVNGVPPGVPPQQAASFLQNKLGFGAGGDPRAAIAASLTATGVPPAMAGGAGAGPVLPSLPPRAQLAATDPNVGMNAAAAAPPVRPPVQAAPVMPTPNQRIAQAPINPSSQVLGPLAAEREAPVLAAPGPDERYYRLHSVNERLSPTKRAEFGLIADQYQRRREAEQQQRLEEWKLYKDERTGDVARRQAYDLGFGKQQSELETARLKREEEQLKTHGIIGDEKYTATLRVLPGHTERLQRIQNLVNEGVFTGLTAPVEMAAARVRAAGGGASDPRIARTERLLSDLAAVGGMARLDVVGPGAPSDKDMELLRDAAAGRITLTADTIREVSAAAQKLQLFNAIGHQRKLEQFAKENPDMAQQVYGRYGLPMENIVPPNHKTVQRLLANADDPDIIRQFDEKYHTPGLANRIIASRARR